MHDGRACDRGGDRQTHHLDEASWRHADYINMLCGVVRDRAPCNEAHWLQESTVGWFMADAEGLWDNGKRYADRAGEIEPGQILTMHVDMDAGMFKFWVDGKPRDPGYTSGVAGPLRWAATLGRIGNTVEIVPMPELQ